MLVIYDSNFVFGLESGVYHILQVLHCFSCIHNFIALKALVARNIPHDNQVVVVNLFSCKRIFTAYTVCVAGNQRI